MVGWICISDLHSGGLTSLLHDLSAEPGAGTEVTQAFAEALGAFLHVLCPGDARKPQLILLGDVLDLQFSTRHAATCDAVAFLRQLAATGCLSDKVIATAGNHDHAIWTEARLAMEARAFEDGRTDSLSHTPAFQETPESRGGLLGAVLRKAGFPELDLRYPNIGFGTDSRAVILHHGHYVEGAYRLVSTVKDALGDRGADPMTIDVLAAENAAWIDFAWSPFNDADSLELLYQNFLTTAGYRRITKAWTDKAAAALSEALPFSGNRTMRDAVWTATKLAMEATLDRARDTERMAEVISLTAGGRAGLQWYLEQPVLQQLKAERPGFDGDVTFVLGHTHRPFSMRVRAEGYRSPVRVYNTGGWTLNGPRLDNAEGAALVLIDEELNTASLRLFSTPRNGTVPAARIEMLTCGQADEAAFRGRLESSLEKTHEHWERLRTVVRDAYFERQRHLLDLTGDPPDAAE
jgi:UDP-2,3-diacylglucosamine pyrophosphatase LpxH